MTDLDGNPLQDNWGGIAYAAWVKTGKGAPTVSIFPVINPDTGLTDPFTQRISWSAVPGDSGYNPAADVNSDGAINFAGLFIVRAEFGHTNCP